MVQGLAVHEKDIGRSPRSSEKSHDLANKP